MSKIRYGNLAVIALGTKKKYKTSPQRITFRKHTNFYNATSNLSFELGYFNTFDSADIAQPDLL